MKTSRRKRTYRDTLARWHTSIYELCRDLNFNPTHQQRELLDLVQGARAGLNSTQIAVKSGQGPGKTRTSGVVALWWNLVHEDSMTVLTAPTMRQCRDVWLKECRKLVKGGTPIVRELVKVTKTRVIIADDDDWGVQLITATNPESAQGAHNENMSIIVEEASGVPRDMIEQYKGTASNPNCLFLMIGNPNTRDCAFFDCFDSLSEHWNTLTWNAEHTPRSRWFDPKRNERVAKEFGENSDVYRVRVRGEFPHADPNVIIDSESLKRCTNPGDHNARFFELVVQQRSARYGGGHAKQIGIDLARFGGDESVIVRRSGNAVVEWWSQPYVEPLDVVARAFDMQYRAGWSNKETMYVMDAGGIGQGVLANFHRANKNIFEFHNGSRASESKKYANKITEAWFHFRERVNAAGVYVPEDIRLARQLTTRQYALNTKQQLVVEPKQQYEKRGFESPDRAEGVLYAFYDPVVSGATASRAARKTRRVGSSAA